MGLYWTSSSCTHHGTYQSPRISRRICRCGLFSWTTMEASPPSPVQAPHSWKFSLMHLPTNLWAGAPSVGTNGSNLIHFVCFLVLHCMLNNITLTAVYLPGIANDLADALPCFQFQRFCRLHSEAEQDPMPCPSYLYPLCCFYL